MAGPRNPTGKQSLWMPSWLTTIVRDIADHENRYIEDVGTSLLVYGVGVYRRMQHDPRIKKDVLLSDAHRVELLLLADLDTSLAIAALQDAEKDFWIENHEQQKRRSSHESRHGDKRT